MRRLVFTVLVLSTSTLANAEEAQPGRPWTVGTPTEMAAAEPGSWIVADDASALTSVTSDMICPAVLNGIGLAGIRSGTYSADCWYPTADREGVWAASMDSPMLESILFVSEAFKQLEADPELTLEPPIESTVGECILIVRRMRHSSGRWTTTRNLFTPDAFHQFRAMTSDDTRQQFLEDLSNELLALSLAAKCEQPVS